MGIGVRQTEKNDKPARGRVGGGERSGEDEEGHALSTTRGHASGAARAQLDERLVQT